MFVGHLAVALGARSKSANAPLGWLVAAAFGLDLLWPVFLLTGIEHVRVEPGATAFTPLAFDHYPWTHSLVMALAWSGAAALLAAWWLRNRRGGALVGAIVASHWLLDLVTHRPDLPAWPGGPELGLGLWNSIPGTLLVEGSLLLGAVVAYSRTTVARDASGRWALRGLVAFTTAIWLSGPWSPPPPGPMAIAAVGLALWLFPLWASWIERHRTSVDPALVGSARTAH
jgi:membrane-bound metal-dependent hydrolase YbcI (DUF457 family)